MNLEAMRARAALVGAWSYESSDARYGGAWTLVDGPSRSGMADHHESVQNNIGCRNGLSGKWYPTEEFYSWSNDDG